MKKEFCLIIDAHVHVGRTIADAEPENFVSLMDNCKIDKAIIFRYFYNKPTIEANIYIQSIVKKFPHHFIGFAWVNPNDKEAVKELRYAATELQLKGVKLHLEMNPTPLSKLKKLFKEAQALEIPLIIHLGEDFDCINVLSQEFNVDIIIAHLGTGVFHLCKTRLEKAISLANNPKIYLETSGNIYRYVKHAVDSLGASKLILGSDFPHEHPLVSTKIVQILEISTQDKELILGKNIKRIIGI